MGILRNSSTVEEWLSVAAVSHWKMTDAEYRSCVTKWRVTFEPLFADPVASKRGRRAMDAMDAWLPCDLLLISLPGYRGIPGHEASHAYGYETRQLRIIDRNVANTCNLILCDRAWSFTCMYTHEWQVLAEPMYLHHFNGVRPQ